MTGVIIGCVLVSLAGVLGLAFAPPRPRAQEAWATLAVAPLFTMIVLAMMVGAR
jgi:hypothetical protein